MNNKKNTIIGVLLLLVTMTIGYALFSETVTIGGTAKGEGNLSIIFTNPSTGGNNIKVTEHGSHGATATIEQNGKKLNIQIPNMEYPTSYVEIPVRIKNNGSIKGYVKKITPDKLDTTDIKVTYTPMKDYYMLNPGDVKDLLIKVEWDVKSTTKVTTGFSIIIDYEQAVTTDTEPNYIPKYYAVGEVVSIGDQQFNVIHDDGDSVTMLAKNVLTKDGLTQTASTDQKVYGIPFSQDGYWHDEEWKSIYKSNYPNLDANGFPVDVYNSNSNTYRIVENYVKKLKNIEKIPENNNKSIEGRLIYFSELVELGYPSKGWDYCTNSENSKWLTNGQFWWIGTVFVTDHIQYVYDNGKLQWYPYYYTDSILGVRPVITIKKTLI